MAEETPENKTLLSNSLGQRDCSDPVVGGNPSNRYDFVPKQDNNDNGPLDIELQEKIGALCSPWYYYNMKVGSLWSLENVTVRKDVLCSGNVVSNNGIHVLSNKKNLPFDIEHPNKKGWRLRHVCIEGPEIAVYCRGKVLEDGIITFPSFWKGFVNFDDITINLTPLGTWQELYIGEIKEDRAVVFNNNKNPIHADYHIVARRLDDDLVVEYEGKSYQDYPNGNSGYSFQYEHDYVENLIKNEVQNILKEKDV
jgi:hypothetical protein